MRREKNILEDGKSSVSVNMSREGATGKLFIQNTGQSSARRSHTGETV